MAINYSSYEFNETYVYIDSVPIMVLLCTYSCYVVVYIPRLYTYIQSKVYLGKLTLLFYTCII